MNKETILRHRERAEMPFTLGMFFEKKQVVVVACVCSLSAVWHRSCMLFSLVLNQKGKTMPKQRNKSRQASPDQSLEKLPAFLPRISSIWRENSGSKLFPELHWPPQWQSDAVRTQSGADSKEKLESVQGNAFPPPAQGQAKDTK